MEHPQHKERAHQVKENLDHAFDHGPKIDRIKTRHPALDHDSKAFFDE